MATGSHTDLEKSEQEHEAECKQLKQECEAECRLRERSRECEDRSHSTSKTLQHAHTSENECSQASKCDKSAEPNSSTECPRPKE